MVAKESVYFPNSDYQMAGDLYYPDGFDELNKYPTIVVSHPGGGVKGQTAGTYARKLAEQGFVTLAFDASHQGQSGGYPRLLENPMDRVEDISVAIDYLATLPFVDLSRIGAFGICAGGGYTITATTIDRRIKAAATVSLVNIGILFREGLNHSVPVETQLQMLEGASTSRNKEANTDTPEYINYVPYTPDEITDQTPTYAREASDYYRTSRALDPTSPDFLLQRSMMPIFQYDSLHLVDKLLTQPLMVIVGTEADTRFMSDELYEAATASANRKLVEIKGATHVDLYDKEEYLDPAVEQAGQFFKDNL